MPRPPRRPPPPPVTPSRRPVPELKLVPLPIAEVPAPVGRVDPSAFEPSDKQVRFHLVAVDLVAAGKVSPVEWLSEHYTRYGERLTAADFAKWKASRGFVQWFYADLAYQPDEHDQAMLDAMFLQRLGEKVAAGDARAMDTYANIRGFRKRPAGSEGDNEGRVEEAIEAWAKQGTADGWADIRKP